MRRYLLAWIGAAVFAASGAAAESPHINYLIHCAGCHLQDGSGKLGEVPSLASMTGRFSKLPEGRAFLVQVPGTSRSPLDNAETAALLNWMLTTFAKVEDLEPFSEQEVAEYRKTRLSDVADARRKVIEKLGNGAGY